MTIASDSQTVCVALNPAIDRVLEVPNLSPGAHQMARLLVRYPGGKAVNLAKGLALLDVPCVLTGLVGREEFDYYAHDMHTHGIRMEMLPVAGHTRENITLVDPVARHETHLRDRGFEVSPTELAELRKKIGDLARPNTIFAFSGALPQGISPAAFGELLTICRNAGSRLAVDVSGPALGTAAGVGPWLIKPNQEEMEELLGRCLPTVSDLTAAGLNLARRIDHVLISRGAEGAYLFAKGSAWHGRCGVPSDRAASTVGCGDALLAGFLAGLCKGLDLAGALKLAVAAAAAAVMSLTTLFEREHFDAMLPQSVVTLLQPKTGTSGTADI